MGFVFLFAWLVPALIFVIGGILLRGQAAARGIRWWVGWLLFIGGGLAVMYVQLAFLFL